jgi:hypothetical protein
MPIELLGRASVVSTLRVDIAGSDLLARKHVGSPVDAAILSRDSIHIPTIDEPGESGLVGTPDAIAGQGHG